MEKIEGDVSCSGKIVIGLKGRHGKHRFHKRTLGKWKVPYTSVPNLSCKATAVINKGDIRSNAGDRTERGPLQRGSCKMSGKK